MVSTMPHGQAQNEFCPVPKTRRHGSAAWSGSLRSLVHVRKRGGMRSAWGLLALFAAPAAAWAPHPRPQLSRGSGHAWRRLGPQYAEEGEEEKATVSHKEPLFNRGRFPKHMCRAAPTRDGRDISWLTGPSHLWTATFTASRSRSRLARPDTNSCRNSPASAGRVTRGGPGPAPLARDLTRRPLSAAAATLAPSLPPSVSLPLPLSCLFLCAVCRASNSPR